MNQDMAFTLAQAFIDGLNNQQHRQMLDLILPDTLYTFQEVKAAVRKLHARSPEVTSAFVYPAATTAIETDPIAKMTQAFQTICDKITTSAASSIASSPYRYNRSPKPLRRCFNCLESSHISPDCTLAPISPEQLQANKEKVYQEMEEWRQRTGTSQPNSQNTTTSSTASQQPPPRQVSFAASTVIPERLPPERLSSEKQQ